MFKKINLFIFFIALLLSILLYFSLQQGLIQSNDFLDILILGIDTQVGFKARADSINLVRINFTRNEIRILSIPRDLYVDIPGFKKDKINHSHFYGGPELTCKTVSNLLGINVKYYVEVNFLMFQKIVDDLGGVSVYIDKPLHYDDFAANLHIHFNPGMKKLTGYEAMGYMRFRMDNLSDWGRIERQQKFFKEFLSQLTKPQNILKYPIIYYNTSDSIKTNLDTDKIIKIAMRLSSIVKNGKIVTGYISGIDKRINGIYYTIGNEKEIKETVKKVLVE